ncbi:pyridoxal-phosphate dependent enzyme [Sphingobium algorifonticola]|uniref:L-serine ammonia-lyase n=1 Tax=Sphingobium algorifonticola TaxID=2008318 RepID=A0A437J5T4_9SPHN|nr:pyridoxal-phosphate dependent enzyme [Sphingobium algorifonticola]RVT40266.1 pyridoxal-phosphate dependent enzyme [Sphingobium algorifonticola]
MSAPLHIDTPLIESGVFRAPGGGTVLFKMDALQPSGSFKLRGVGRLCAAAAVDGARAIVCPSGGNAGFAAAYAGQRLGMAVTVVVPETTSPEARNAIAAAGADVHVHGADFDAADAQARQVAAATGAVHVHPFDHPLLWDGHATLIDEVVRAGATFDCVVTSVGGGGLLLGILAGLARNGLGDIPVIAVETEGAASLHAALAADRVVSLPAITSIATSLGARSVSPAAFDAAKRKLVIPLQVNDADAVAACLRFADAHRVLVEPACGAAIAALTARADVLTRFERPLVEICGGIGVSLDRLADWRAHLAN